MVRTVQINTARLDNKIRRTTNAIQRQGLETTKELGRVGRDYAKSKVPIDTGRLRKAIRTIFFQKGNRIEAEIQSNNPTYPRRGRRNFDLPLWWAEKSPAPKPRKGSRRARYMQATTTYLNKQKKGIAQRQFENIKIR